MFSRKSSGKPHLKNPLTALQYAVKLLSSRAYSEKKIREKLRARTYSQTEIDGAVSRLIEERLIDDRKYAEAFVRTRLEPPPRPAMILDGKLMQRGISKPLAHEVTKSLAPNPADENLAGELVRRKKKQYAALDDAIRRRRLTSFLARRGFSFGTISKVLSSRNREDDFDS
jgi:regulatory protein